MKLAIPEPRLLHSWGSIDLFKSITSNIAHFVSITWHQNEPLGCAVYLHCLTNDSWNMYT